MFASYSGFSGNQSLEVTQPLASSHQHQPYLISQQIPNFYPNQINHLPPNLEYSEQCEGDYQNQRLQEHDLQMKQNQLPNYSTRQLQPYDHQYKQEHHNYQGLSHYYDNNSYQTSRFRILESGNVGSYHASYSALSPDQEYNYTPSPHQVHPSQRAYFDSSFRSQAHVQSGIPYESVPQPSQFEAHYESQLLEYQRTAIQSRNMDEGEKITFFQEGMIVEQQLDYYQSEVMEEPFRKDSALILMNCSETKCATEKIERDAQPIIRKRRTTNLILRSSSSIPSKSVPVSLIRKPNAANTRGNSRSNKLNIPTVIIQAPSPSETKQIYQNRLNNASVNVPILPIRSSTGQKSLAGLLNLPKVKPIPSVKLEEAEEQDEKEQEYAPEFCSDEEEFILRTSSNSKKKLEKKGIRVSRISTSIEISTEPSKIGNDVKPFIAKLDYILSNPKTYGDILRWDSTGMYLILNSTSHKLVSEVLPNFFSHKSVPAFQRQLNVYQFVRIFGEQLEEILQYSSCPLQSHFYNVYKHQSFLKSISKKKLKYFIPKPSTARIAANDEKNGLSNSYQSRKLIKQIKFEGQIERKRVRDEKKLVVSEVVGVVESDGSSPLTELEEDDSDDDFEDKVEMEEAEEEY